MEKMYFSVANSPVMAAFCGLAILVVLVQAAIFFRTAWKRALELGFEKRDLMKVVKSSARKHILGIVPLYRQEEQRPVFRGAIITYYHQLHDPDAGPGKIFRVAQAFGHWLRLL